MSIKRSFEDYKKLAKRANQRLREMEKHPDKLSPAYKNAQALLEQMGVKGNGVTGRRFSERKTMTWNEYQQRIKTVKNFLSSETSTVSGFKRHQDRVWNTANERYHLSESGISKEQYFEFWKNYPEKEKDRLLGSQRVISVLSTYTWKHGKKKRDQELTGAEIAELISKESDYKSALKSIGLTREDIAEYESAKHSGKLLGGNNAKSKSKNRKRK